MGPLKKSNNVHFGVCGEFLSDHVDGLHVILVIPFFVAFVLYV